MVRVDFEGFIKDLSAYFERTKAPTLKTMDLWFEDVRHIPVKHLANLFSEARNLDVWPRNLPAWMRSKSCEIAEKNGENNQYAIHPRRLRPKSYAQISCKQCQGAGLIPWPMDWPLYRDEDGKIITRKFTPQALCPCTDKAEYAF